MPVLARVLVIAAAAAALATPSPRALAQDAGKAEGGGEAATEAPKPAELYDQLDRKHTMCMKLPRTWKLLTGEETPQNALAAFAGPYDANSTGQVNFFTYPNFQRALLARAR